MFKKGVLYTCHSQYIEYAYLSSPPRPHGGATVVAIFAITTGGPEFGILFCIIIGIMLRSAEQHIQMFCGRSYSAGSDVVFC